jgi:CSLREA domain-containing protein/uncharacterized repeat protein (TIGR01451 family)
MSRYPRPLFHAILVAMVASLCTVAAVPPPVAKAAGTFTVTTTADEDGQQCPDSVTGFCSLRQAINAANEAGDAIINFDIPSFINDAPEPGFETNGVVRTWRITLDGGLGGLPALENGTDIDGWTQESANPGVFNPIGPDVIIDGRNLLNRSGITINSPTSVSEVKGVAIVNFDGTGGFGQGVGINVVSGSGHIIQGNFVGVDQQNTVGGQAGPNGFAGIWIQSGASGVVIGGQLINQRESNIISNNDLDGIVIQGNGNFVRGNFIGTDYGAFNNLPNQGAGVLVYSSSGNIIGASAGQNSTFGNYISGNRDFGIVLDGGRDTVVTGNSIGIGVNSVSGQAVRSAPNGAGGIEINSDTRSATNNAIGVAGRPRNYIAGNNGPGIILRSTNTSGTSIVNNLIGLRADGNPMSAPNNVGGGIVVTGGAKNVTIGGPTFDDSNVISANNGDGIFIQGPSSNAKSTNNTIIGNCIGTGTACAFNRTIPSNWANARAGIVIGNFVQQTTIGGLGEAANVIGYNTTYGVAITGTQVLDTTLAGNKIRFHSQDGVYVQSARNTQILGEDTAEAAQQSEISDNLQNGVRLIDATINNMEFVRLENNGQNGIWATGSTTTTLQFLTVNLNKANGVLLEGALRDVTVAGNTVLTNTLNGIIGTGSWTNTIVNANIVRGHNGSGISISGPATDTTINNNTVYTNTLGVGVTPPVHGITLGAGLRATISGNRVRGNANGAGISLGSVDDANITSNPEIERNGLEGIRIVGTLADQALNPRITSNTVLSNTLLVGALGGIAATQTLNGQISGNVVRFNRNAPGIALDATSSTQLQSNVATVNQVGLSVTGGISTTVRATLLDRNLQHGLLATSTSQFTMTQTSSLSFNAGSGARLLGNSSQLTIIDTQVFSNTTNGIQVGDGAGGPYPQRVRISNNRITGNGIPVNAAGVPTVPLPVDAAYRGLGIVFSPDGPPEVATNPNHDINPPFGLTLSASGQLVGQVNVGAGPEGCSPADQCRVQVFRANRVTQDGQGWQKIGGDITPDATGVFTASLGVVPAHLAVTATDGQGNTSRFAPFTTAPSLAIGPARSATASPGDVIVYTHRVTNTGNLALSNLQLSATSSRGWDQIVRSPSTQFALAPGASREISVTVTLPTGSDPRVAAGGQPDLLTVQVQGSYQLEGEATQRTVQAQVVDTTTVAAKVVLDIDPASLTGRGAPGTQLPYVHTIRNNGNIAAQFTVAASTDLGPSWVTEVTPAGTIELAPGESAQVTVLVTVPALGTGVQEGTEAVTTLQITTTGPNADPTQNKQAVDTTTVTLVTLASVIADEVRDGAADEVTTIPHRVTNLSNGEATFRLAYSSSLGSTVTFRSATNGVPISAVTNTFTLGTQPDGTPPSQLDFFADVRVNRSALAGQRDSIIIYLLDGQGNVVGGAFVRDTVNVTRGAIAPRIYLPLTYR